MERIIVSQHHIVGALPPDDRSGVGAAGVSLQMEERVMRYYCSFIWFPHVSREMVAKRLVEQHDAGENNPDNIIGWYNLAGGGAGFLIVDYDDPRGVTRFLSPYMDLMSFDVRAVYELDYDERIEELRVVTTDD